MKVRNLAVRGALEFTPTVHFDDRGVFVSPFQESAFVDAVGSPLFSVAQTNHTRSGRGVVERGAGLVVDVARPSVEAVREQLVRILTEPSFAEGAAGLYEDMLATPSPNDIVPVLEKLTAQHRREAAA